MSRMMKNSSIKWLRLIPEDWKVYKLKHIADIQTGNTPSDPQNIKFSKTEGIDWIKTNNLLGTSGVSFSLLKIKKEYIHESRIAKVGDTLVSCIGDIGKLGFVLEKTAFNQQINAITFYKNNIHWKFGMYSLFIQDEQQKSFANGNVLKILNKESQKNIRIAVPMDIKEQKKIVKVLDYYTNSIESIIKESRESIEELKKYKQSLITEAVTKGLDSTVEMKNSGIEWIGKIPKHWNLIKIKYVVQIRNNKDKFKKNDIYIGLENVKSFDGKLLNYSQIEEDSLEIACEKFDVLFSQLRPYLAKAFISPYKGSCSSEFIIFKSFKGPKEFLLYYLLSHGFINYINSTSYGSKMPRTSWEIIKETFIPLPSYQEMENIGRFLQNKSEIIDKLIEDKTKVIEELENYKKSLIYEYVTGKKEV